MATKDFLLPDLGEGLTEGEIVSWGVEVGDHVVVDEPIAEVETAKAVVELPSPFAGRVTSRHAEVGDEVAVGQPLVTIELDAAQPSDSAAAAAQPTGGGEEPAAGGAERPLVGYGAAEGAGRRRRRHARQRQGTERRQDGAASQGNGQAGPPRDGGAGPPRDGGAGPPRDGRGRPLAKPPVRKLAKDLGIDLTAVPGSGPEGVITREDVEAFAERGVHAPDAATERVPLRGVRKAIADRVATSHDEIPEAFASVDCDATELVSVAERLDASEPEARISSLVLVMRACVVGLATFPQLNARFDAEAGEILLQRAVNIGVAAQTDRGLLVPVIKQAHERSTRSLAAELSRLAAAAREGTLAPDELTGSTFSVSNYGSLGVDAGAPIINHPETAILGVGRIAERPWVVDGQLAVRKVTTLTVGFDHRVCDGGEAAGFLRFVADCVEDPALLLGHL